MHVCACVLGGSLVFALYLKCGHRCKVRNADVTFVRGRWIRTTRKEEVITFRDTTPKFARRNEENC
jgi:hypothetical protein